MNSITYSASTEANFGLMIQEHNGQYRMATADEILAVARAAAEHKVRRGASLDSPTVSKEFFTAKLASYEREVFAVAFLDNHNKLIQYSEIFMGTINIANVYPREVLKEALRVNAAAMIVSHNHPSGDTTPSAGDRALTKLLKDALDMVEVRLLDHVIVGGGQAISMAERGLM